MPCRGSVGSGVLLTRRPAALAVVSVVREAQRHAPSLPYALAAPLFSLCPKKTRAVPGRPPAHHGGGDTASLEQQFLPLTHSWGVGAAYSLPWDQLQWALRKAQSGRQRPCESWCVLELLQDAACGHTAATFRVPRLLGTLLSPTQPAVQDRNKLPLARGLQRGGRKAQGLGRHQSSQPLGQGHQLQPVRPGRWSLVSRWV